MKYCLYGIIILTAAVLVLHAINVIDDLIERRRRRKEREWSRRG